MVSAVPAMAVVEDLMLSCLAFELDHENGLHRGLVAGG